MYIDVFIKLVFFDIEIDIRDIIARLKDNNLFYFRMWKKRTTMISFNFESSITMLISKQHNIKFVITKKISISDIKLVLLYIVFKSDIANKKRFNLVDKFILKSHYSDISFDSNSIFNSNAPRKINIDIFNLWYIRMNHLGH